MVMRDPTHIVETILRFAQLNNSEIGLHNTKDTAAHLENPEGRGRFFGGKNTVSHFGIIKGAQSFKLNA